MFFVSLVLYPYLFLCYDGILSAYFPEKNIFWAQWAPANEVKERVFGEHAWLYDIYLNMENLVVLGFPLLLAAAFSLWLLRRTVPMVGLGLLGVIFYIQGVFIFMMLDFSRSS